MLLAASGCSSFHGVNGTDNQGVVVGNGDIREIPVAKRGAPVTMSGSDLDGKPIALESMRGKPTVVNVWGSWCTQCHREEPYLVAAAKKLGDRANFVGIDSRDNGSSQAKAYSTRYGITWPSFFSPGGEALLTFRDVVANAIPSTIVLDAEGRVSAAVIGALPSALTLEEIVKDVIRSG